MAGPITAGISSSLVSTINRLSQDDLQDLVVYGVGISSESITSMELIEVTNQTFTISWNGVNKLTYPYPAEYAWKLYPNDETYTNWAVDFPNIFLEMIQKVKNKSQLKWWDLNHGTNNVMVNKPS